MRWWVVAREAIGNAFLFGLLFLLFLRFGFDPLIATLDWVLTTMEKV